MKIVRTSLTVLIILNLIFIWGNSILPRQKSADISNTVETVVEKIVASAEDKEDILEVVVRKAAHIIEFAMLGALLTLRMYLGGVRRFWLISFCCAVAVGGIDETIQVFSNRGALVSDVAFDAIGGLLGVAIAAFVIFFIKLIRRKRLRINA